jgi:hypothetical protein
MYFSGVVLFIIGALVLTALFTGPYERFSLYLSGPTKCFSCERDMIARHGNSAFAWMGKPSKCFDCERQLALIDPQLANHTHGTKCFDCERQFAHTDP